MDPEQRHTRNQLVLVHGLGRSSRAMLPIALAARRRGYRVLNLGYRSRSGGIATHAAYLAAMVNRHEPHLPLHFITHSLGGIVLRYAVAHSFLDSSRIARCVMLAPPNQGSEVATFVTENPAMRRVGVRVLGPSGAELGTGARGIVRQLPPVSFELGVIAGNRASNPLFQRLLHEENDGTVTVAGTAVEGMQDSIVVRSSHSFIMMSPRVITEAFNFLEQGSFSHPER